MSLWSKIKELFTGVSDGGAPRSANQASASGELTVKTDGSTAITRSGNSVRGAPSTPVQPPDVRTEGQNDFFSTDEVSPPPPTVPGPAKEPYELEPIPLKDRGPNTRARRAKGRVSGTGPKPTRAPRKTPKGPDGS